MEQKKITKKINEAVAVSRNKVEAFIKDRTEKKKEATKKKMNKMLECDAEDKTASKKRETKPEEVIVLKDSLSSVDGWNDNE